VLVLKGSFMDVLWAIIVIVPLITPPVGMNLCLSACRFEKQI